MPHDSSRLNSVVSEAANRAEATALLIRCGFHVYRPEADIEGEDLVLRTPWRPGGPPGELIGVQLKGQPVVDWKRYGDRDLYLLFPSAAFSPDNPREWYLGRHDDLFAWIFERHRKTPKWDGHWSYPSITVELRDFLTDGQWKVQSSSAERHEDKFGLTPVPVDLTNQD